MFYLVKNIGDYIGTEYKKFTTVFVTLRRVRRGVLCIHFLYAGGFILKRAGFMTVVRGTGYALLKIPNLISEDLIILVRCFICNLKLH